MDQDFFKFGLAAFVTLLVVVDPPGVVPIFVALTRDESPQRRSTILRRAIVIAFGVAIFFLLAGRTVLSYLGVTVHAFSISGGILLFAAAMPMLFGHRGGLQSPEPNEKPAVGEDISVFPPGYSHAIRPWCNCYDPPAHGTGSWGPAPARRSSCGYRTGFHLRLCVAISRFAFDCAAGRGLGTHRDARDGDRAGGACRSIRA
jgi:hypothetical protein